MSIKSSFVLNGISLVRLSWWSWLLDLGVIGCTCCFESSLCFFVAAQVHAVLGSIMLCLDGVEVIQHLQHQPQGNGLAISGLTVAPAMEVSQFHLRFRLIWCDASVCILYFFGSIEIFISGPLELLKYFCFFFQCRIAINNA